MTLRSIYVKAGAAASMVIMSGAAMAAAPSTPLELLTAQSATFLSDTKGVLFAGAGLVIGALLVVKLVNLVIRFFQKG